MLQKKKKERKKSEKRKVRKGKKNISKKTKQNKTKQNKHSTLEEVAGDEDEAWGVVEVWEIWGFLEETLVLGARAMRKEDGVWQGGKSGGRRIIVLL